MNRVVKKRLLQIIPVTTPSNDFAESAVLQTTAQGFPGSEKREGGSEEGGRVA